MPVKTENNNKLRPCYIMGKYKFGYAYFHCWGNKENETKAIVELFNGLVTYVNPSELCFMDTWYKDEKEFREVYSKFLRDRRLREEGKLICGITNVECIGCKPGACENRREKKDETSN